MQQCRKHLQRQVNPFDVAGLAAEKEELEKKMGAPDFWDDVEAANKANYHLLHNMSFCTKDKYSD